MNQFREHIQMTHFSYLNQNNKVGAIYYFYLYPSVKILRAYPYAVHQYEAIKKASSVTNMLSTKIPNFYSSHLLFIF